MSDAAIYASIFERARTREYPTIDAFEQQMGHAVFRSRLDEAARVLNCPIKGNPPNWQHGRVVYAAARRYCEQAIESPLLLFDIGTAKGFSAICLQWALDEAHRTGRVVSVDVINPCARVRRNTVAEINGYKTLAETLEPWPEAEKITFECTTGLAWLANHQDRVHVAFVDGKHTDEVVSAELSLLAARQAPGDIVILDDLQIEDVALAVRRAARDYEMQRIEAHSARVYALGTRR